MSEDPVSPRAGERDQWLAIELRHLAALATVAQQASFSSAARSLGYVQSAVSQQIRSLERIVGCRLLDRGARPRSVTVTDAGRTLLDHIDEILEELRLAKEEFDALNRQPEVRASFGVDAIFGSWLPAAVLGSLLPSAGGASWNRVEQASAGALLEQVRRRELEAAFVPLPIASGPFFAQELARQRYLLAFPGDSRCKTIQTVLERHPLVSIDGCAGTAAVLRGRAGAARRADTLHAANGPTSALAFVRSGAAAAVLTGPDIVDHPNVMTLPLPEVADRVVGVAWHRDRDDDRTVVALRAAALNAVPSASDP
jgi:DNA-binding transcriptional LysR family regulator